MKLCFSAYLVYAPGKFFLNLILISFIISKVGIIIPIGVGLLSTVAGENAYILGLWLSLMVSKEELVITMLSLKKTLDDGYYITLVRNAYC